MRYYEITEGVELPSKNHAIIFAIVVAEKYHTSPVFEATAQKAWSALTRHNVDVMLKRIKGTGIKIVPSETDPYSQYSNDPKMMVRYMLYDMIKNNQLKIFTGETDHPVWTKEENIAFRTVHDFVAHGKLRNVFQKQISKIPPNVPDNQLKKYLQDINLNSSGNIGHNFSYRGELNAYLSQARLAPKDAIPALFTEIVGQASYSTIVGDFPVQKVVILEGFDFKRVGLTLPNSWADYRSKELFEQLKTTTTLNTEFGVIDVDAISKKW